jgi:hypothetical protein
MLQWLRPQKTPILSAAGGESQQNQRLRDCRQCPLSSAGFDIRAGGWPFFLARNLVRVHPGVSDFQQFVHRLTVRGI